MISDSQAMERLKALLDDDDTEGAHAAADAVLCELLTALGYEQVVEAWNKINKWYA
jgi:hypothetical protein